MFEFKQNDAMTYIDNPYVNKNTFIGRQKDTSTPPTYEQIKNKLPIPVFDGHDDYIACYNYAWQTAFSNIGDVKDSEKLISHYIDAAFNGCLFMWDCSFMLMFGKYAARLFNFQKTLDNFYALQHRDGFICRTIYEKTGYDRFGRFDPSATGPNIMPWCEWLYYKNFGDKERLGRVYFPLRAYHMWLRNNHTWRDGTYFSSGWGCGMDNSPRLSEGYHDEFSHGHMVWIDACLQQVLSCDILIKMNGILNVDDVSDLIAERDRLKKYLNLNAWDKDTAFYYDVYRDNSLNMVKHIGAYWALLADVLPSENKDKFIDHLTNENEFNRPNSVPTLSYDHEKYDEKGGYWCGAVWAPTNYMVLSGLTQNGYDDLAHEIAEKYLKNVVGVFNNTGTLWENYSAENECQGVPARPNFVGWTGLAPISIFFEYVLGIKADSENNRIIWDINHTEKHGIKQYPFGNEHIVDLVCEARNSPTDEPVVNIKSNKPIDIVLKWNGNTKKVHIE